MNIVFYSPFARADADRPSGAMQMADLLVRALRVAGAEVSTPVLPRTFDAQGNVGTQQSAMLNSIQAGDELLLLYSQEKLPRPDLWFSYHVYYKSPDWIGPRIARTLGIPYVIAEGSYAPKRSGGPWNTGHVASTEALKCANLLLAMTRFDQFCLAQLCPGHVQLFMPFIDAAMFPPASHTPGGSLKLVSVGMMRNVRKRDSYRLLAAALAQVRDFKFQLSIAGDGVFRAEIEQEFKAVSGVHDVVFLGAVPRKQLVDLYAQSDILVWPGIGEAYGLAYLEAQACGLPVVACRERGVVDVTLEGETALLCETTDETAFAGNIRRLAIDSGLRKQMSANARSFVVPDRTLAAAADRLKILLGALIQ